MNDSSGEGLTEASYILWLAGPAVLMLAVHVALGYIRLARREGPPRVRWLAQLAASAALGAGVWSAMVLAMSAQAMPYELGFSGLGISAALLLAVALCSLPVAALAHRPGPLALTLAAVVLGAGVPAVQVVLVWCAGLLPGVEWRQEIIALALPLVAAGAVGAFWVAFLAGGRAGEKRVAWRLAAAAMLTLSVVLGQELVLAAAGMAGQQRSGFDNEVPAAAAWLLACVGWPMALLMLLLDLRLRRSLRPGSSVQPKPRRKRHYGSRRL